MDNGAIPEVVKQSKLTNDLIGSIVDLSPFVKNISSQRLQMFGSHVSQHPPVKGATEPMITTGAANEYAKYMFDVKMPEDGIILKTFQMYPKQMSGGIKKNPLTVVFYEAINSDQDKIGVVFLNPYVQNHTSHDFGYELKPTKALSNLVEGARIPGGTVFLSAPSVSKNQSFMYGVEHNVAFMSIPQVIEDGAVVSESFCRKNATTGIARRVLNFGRNTFPLLLNGTAENPKILPDIGEVIRDDGILVAIREYDPLMAPIDMHPKNIVTPNHIFDKFERVLHAGARVINIEVQCNENITNPAMPEVMETQLRKYYEGEQRFYKNISDYYVSLKRKYGAKHGFQNGRSEVHPIVNVLTPETNNFITHCLGMVGLDNSRVKKSYKGDSIDRWRVVVTLEYDIIPTVGYKITNCGGGKCVIVDVKPDADMPINAHGVRADVIMDGDSTIKRKNPGVTFEQYINSASQHVRYRMEQMVANGDRSGAKALLFDYYSKMAPEMYEAYTNEDFFNEKDRDEIFENVLNNQELNGGIQLFMSSSTRVNGIDAVRVAKNHFPPPFEPVTYRDGSGELVTTVSNFIIGSMYIMLLEKIAEDWGASSIVKRQHFGIPAKLSAVDKYSTLGRETSTRTVGESEARLYAAVYGGKEIGHRIEQNNSGEALDIIAESLFSAEKPTNLGRWCITGDNEFKGRPHQYTEHVLRCSGINIYKEAML